MLKKKFISFLYKLGILTFVLAAISYFLFSSYLADYYLPVFPWLLGFFVLVTALVHFFHLKAQQSTASVFARYAIGINGAKVFLYLIFILIQIFLFRDTAVIFLFGFFVCYLVFNVFEVALYQKVMREKKREELLQK
jgi:hypothetical protein